MPQYLVLDEVKARAAEVAACFEQLMRSPRVVVRPASRQWAFLRECFERLLYPKGVEAGLERKRAVQYRFEIEARLREYYQNPSSAHAFVFSLVDHTYALRQRWCDEDYPSTAGYVLLVARSRPEQAPQQRERELREYLARVVEDAARAELAVYSALPALDLSPLRGLFSPAGSAYRRIQDVAERRARGHETIRHPEYNPSTMRTLEVRVVQVGEREARVVTREYWYLRWWSLVEARYTYVYTETNRQRYFLVEDGGRWLVDSNIYPPPRVAASLRISRGGQARR